MVERIITKKNLIKILRNNDYNCFPIPENQREADDKYDAARTKHNQIIQDNENFGYIPIEGTGTAIVDLDDKEEFRKFAEYMISKGYMVIETGRGWHIPVKGLNGIISKMMLYNYKLEPDKQIIDIQGPKHYCVGPGSEVFHDKLQKQVIYENKGTDIIWDANGMEFHEFIDDICVQCNVTGRTKKSRSSYRNMRERFKNGYPPTKGTSNNYFFQAAIQCNTDGLSEDKAIEKIKKVYDKWSISDGFSDRPWSNIEAKIRDVYENDKKLEAGRPKGASKSSIDRTEIAQEMIAGRKIFSDVDTDEIFENCNGFLEKINNTLLREMMHRYPEMEQADYNSILFKLKGLAEPITPTNKHLIVFKNGVYDKRVKSLIETDELADMGFKEYDYLLPTEENKPTQFISITFDNIPNYEHSRINAGLRSVLSNYLDPKISVIYGLSGVGKSTPLIILVEILGEYAMEVELDKLLQDRFIRTKLNGLRLLVLQDLPQDWKDFSQLKVMTGEARLNERGFMQDSARFANKLKIWASGNYLAEIPENEKNAMYTRRLSLLHNIRDEPYPEDQEFSDRIIKEEGEKIISWILNIPDEKCQYENSTTVRSEWEKLASPEIGYLEENYTITSENVEVSVYNIVQLFNEKNDTVISIDRMGKALKKLGYINKFNIIKNIKIKPIERPKKTTQNTENHTMMAYSN